MFTIDLRGKTGLVMGVTNQRSIAWSIARPLADAGARLAFSYQGERLKPTLDDLTKDMNDPILAECDVTDDAQLDALFARLKRELGRLDFVVHAIAYAPASTFSEPFRQTSRDDWRLAMDVSAYSLVAVANRAAELMDDGGAIVTMSYLAGERVVPHYNMMGVAKAALEASVRYLAYDLGPAGVRVNALSAGPVRTVAARSIAGLRRHVRRSRQAVDAEAQHHHRRGRPDGVRARDRPVGRRDGRDGPRRRRVPRDRHVPRGSDASSVTGLRTAARQARGGALGCSLVGAAVRTQAWTGVRGRWRGTDRPTPR
ncbi:MAG: SDR family oxidoreductase [Trueperaceae bacterium]|nr:SDR family oxidoreductase [Trueperaceae bacterium]